MDHVGYVYFASYLSNKNQVISAGGDGIIKIWDI
jgi:hypothetical protein